MKLSPAAGKIIMASPEFQRLLKDVGARIVADPPQCLGGRVAGWAGAMIRVFRVEDPAMLNQVGAGDR